MRLEDGQPASPSSPPVGVPSATLQMGRSAIEEKMVALYQTIVSRVGSRAPRTVQFMSARPGEGSSVIARELACVASRKLGKSVLLIDVNRPGCQAKALGVDVERGWQEVLADERPVSDASVRVGQEMLYLAVLSASDALPPAIIETSAFDAALEEAAAVHDLVLVDAPPASESAEGLVMSPKLSGTILVIEAGATRWQVTGSVQQRIASYGGEILGAILNKRRDYIPGFIYSHM